MDGEFNFGYDVMIGEYGDLIDKGVFDLKKVICFGV